MKGSVFALAVAPLLSFIVVYFGLIEAERSQMNKEPIDDRYFVQSSASQIRLFVPPEPRSTAIEVPRAFGELRVQLPQDFVAYVAEHIQEPETDAWVLSLTGRKSIEELEAYFVKTLQDSGYRVSQEGAGPINFQNSEWNGLILLSISPDGDSKVDICVFRGRRT